MRGERGLGAGRGRDGVSEGVGCKEKYCLGVDRGLRDDEV